MAMMKKSMKAMKAKKSMKAMKAARKMKKAMRVSKVGKRASVFRGSKAKTVGGLTKAHLKKNKDGKIVSRKASDAARKRKGYKSIVKWGQAFKAARRALNIKGFCPCGGKTQQGQALLRRTRSLFRK